MTRKLCAMTRSRPGRLVAVVAAVLLGCVPGVAAQGVPPRLEASVDVNVVFVGFERKTYFGRGDEPHDLRAVYADAFEQVFLPRTNDPVIKTESFLTGSFRPVPTGETLRYRPHVLFAPSRWEEALFAHLTAIGRPGPRTAFQEVYNAEAGNGVDIPESVLRIPGPAVEQWLAEHAQQVPGYVPGADTIVFINWFGRPGFRHHLYQGDGRDPDTGRDDATNDMAGVAWGGSGERLWFYDLSAGPDITNYRVDDPVFDQALPIGDAPFHERIPPIWDMRPEQPYWLLGDVTAATGFLARYSLYHQFGAAPLYDPLATLPAAGRRRIARLNLFRGTDATPTADLVKPQALAESLGAAQPDVPVDVSLVERPLAGQDLASFEIFARGTRGEATEAGCWEPFGHPGWQLLCDIESRPAELAAPGDPGDVVIPQMTYALGDEQPTPPFVGIADSDLAGKPRYVYAHTTPAARQNWRRMSPGSGLTSLLVHENGHAFGLAHTHSGWDSERGRVTGPFVARWAYAFDECRCPMGYLGAGARFGRFERDNLDRTLTARLYTTTVRALAMQRVPDAARIEADLRLALSHYRAQRYRDAVLAARRAFARTEAQAGPDAMARARDTGARPVERGHRTVHGDPGHDDPVVPPSGEPPLSSRSFAEDVPAARAYLAGAAGK